MFYNLNHGTRKLKKKGPAPMKYYYLLLVCVVSICTIQQPLYAISTGCVWGAVQFPETIVNVPYITVYTCGQKVPRERCFTTTSGQFGFQIPHVALQPPLYLAITPEISFHKHPDEGNNTIDFLKIGNDTLYKLYKLTPIRTTAQTGSHVTWDIQSISIDQDTRRLPDETIIIYYNPLYVDHVSGGSEFELPTIYLKSNLIDIVGGSEALLQLASDTVALNSIETNTLHACVHPPIVRSARTTIIGPTV